ncbi:MAG: hypothetical protein JSR97_12475 [Verrucomicrobia bacterium]|nr:hypothetical protein [Verrucomicrobiota bacterium]
MYKLLIIAAVISLSACSRKVLPTQTSREVTDSTHTETIISYRTDSVFIPGEKVMIEKVIPCPGLKINEQKTTGKAHLEVSIDSGKLKIECRTDSLVHVIDSLKEMQTKIMRFRNTVVTVKEPFEVIKNRIPGWVFILVIANLLYITGRLTGKIRF